ncbi:MAG: hypothetical protein WA055_01295 [Candidatus Moraniibacteriota bacterium]
MKNLKLIKIFIVIIFIPYVFCWSGENALSNDKPDSFAEMERMSNERDVYCGKIEVDNILEQCLNIKSAEVKAEGIGTNFNKTNECFAKLDKKEDEYMECMNLCSGYKTRSKGWFDCYYDEYKIKSIYKSSDFYDYSEGTPQRCVETCFDEEDARCIKSFPCIKIEGQTYSDCSKQNTCNEEAQENCQKSCYASSRSSNDYMILDNNDSNNRDNGGGDADDEDNKNDKTSDDVKNNENYNLIGLPVDSRIDISPCIGITPRNSELCPGHDKDVFFYERKHLVDVCSPIEESGPRCEYICKTEHLADGTCKEEGYFKKILNWLGGLF